MTDHGRADVRTVGAALTTLVVFVAVAGSAVARLLYQGEPVEACLGLVAVWVASQHLLDLKR